MNTLHLSKIIITNNGQAIFDGGLLTENLKVLQVSKKEDFGNLKNVQVIDHGESLICPGFINLHTHLLYSKTPVRLLRRFASRNDNTEEGLFPWLEKLVEKTNSRTEKDYIESINYGIKKTLSSGTTFVVENTPDLLSAKELSKSHLKALVGIEVFSSDEEKADEILQQSIELTKSIEGQDLSCPYIDFTLSPHAPYDVSKPLWKRLIQWAEENNKPLLTHLEESPQEKLWWQEKSGDAVKFWKNINKLEPKLKYWKKYNSGIDFLNKNNLLSKNIIATHLCQASLEDLKTLKEKNIRLVHSPRSNFYLNNGTANLKLWNELDFLWGIGTDSIASNENLDLLEEIKFAINQQNLIYNFKLSAKEAFKAITLNAAKVISKDKELGSFKEGCFADFLIYNIKNKPASTYRDPYNLIIEELNNNNHLKEVWINGSIAWSRDEILTKI